MPGKPRIGLALSGGGSRAIAFHLGCLRALHDRGILKKVDVISSISGGSVIAALYAYLDEPFVAFDERVTAVLRRGPLRDIAREVLFSSNTPKILAAAFTVTPIGVLANALHAALGLPFINKVPLPFDRAYIQPPFRRFASRTTAFEAALHKRYYDQKTMPEIGRPGLDIIINATELRTQTAFRFGSQESGTWRFGTVPQNNIPVAKAVAASAAFPPGLPALDEKLNFAPKNGTVQNQRVLLTDGGIYDNLGVTPLEPGRNSSISLNVYPVDTIISCDAGHGQPQGHFIPYFWPTRMNEAFDTTFRRVQTATYGRLHSYVQNGQLSGFLAPYLGQIDERLPYPLPGLIPRTKVISYPTDFSAMTQANIDMLAGRGEQLTGLLATH